jgi:hypothetical protein
MAKPSYSRGPGKWERAISSIKETPVAQEFDIEVVKVISPAVNVNNVSPNDNVVDLYSVGHEEITRTMCDEGVESLFKHTLHILGPQGEVVRVAALFNGCAMVAVMCSTVFNKVKHRIGRWRRSEKRLRMENGIIVPLMAVWSGKMRLGGVTIEGKFEVFDSKGSWAFFLEKPLLRLFWADCSSAHEPQHPTLNHVSSSSVPCPFPFSQSVSALDAF